MFGFWGGRVILLEGVMWIKSGVSNIGLCGGRSVSNIKVEEVGF